MVNKIPLNIKRMYETFARARVIRNTITITKKDIDGNQPPGGPWQYWVGWNDYIWYHDILCKIQLSRAKYKITEKTTELARIITTMMEEEGAFKTNTGRNPVSRRLGGKVRRVIPDDE